MNILFQSIPIGIRANELAAFIQSRLNKSDLNGHELHISVASIEILEIQDNFTHPIEQFGVVRFSDPELAKKIIKKLNGLNFNNHHITVREFFDRDDKNDPRGKKLEPSEVLAEKRVKDRRKYFLKNSRLI